jgi:biotin transport system substrate-specific component
MEVFMSSNVKNITQTAIFVAVLCVISPFSLTLPVSPVPISLATFAVYIFSTILGTKKSLIGLVVYMLIGIVGLPVFSKGGSGIGVILGPTGGYLVGYFFCALGSSLGYEAGERISSVRIVRVIILALGMVMGTVICYLFGTVWLSYLNKLNFEAAFAAGVIPFIPGCVIKIVISVILAVPLKNRLKLFM